jgi:hypothetical protein
MRRGAWLALALIAPALAACGGDSEPSSTPVQKPPMTVPGEATDLTQPTDTETDTTETSPDTAGTTPTTTAPQDQATEGNGGAQAPDSGAPPSSQEDSPANDTPPEPGSPADRFEQFCAQNPGAC